MALKTFPLLLDFLSVRANKFVGSAYLFNPHIFVFPLFGGGGGLRVSRNGTDSPLVPLFRSLLAFGQL